MTAILLSLENLQEQFPALYFWADSFLKASLVLLLATLLHWIYRRQPASSHGLIWLISITSCLCIPIFKLLIPDIDLTVEVQQINSADSSLADKSRIFSSSTEVLPTRDILLPILKAGYLVGLLLMLVNLATSVVRLLRISSHADDRPHANLKQSLQQLMRSQGISANVTLLVSSQTRTPFTWGIFHHRLVLPATAVHWNQQLIKQAIAHELGHIQRNDWIYQLLGRIALCFYWPNPLFWHAIKCLKIASEKASDDTAADCSSSDIDYASNLLLLANSIKHKNLYPPLAMGMFSTPSVLSERIHHILRTNRNRSLLRADEILVSTVMTLLLVAPFSSLQVSAQAFEPAIAKEVLIPLVVDSPSSQVIFDDGVESVKRTPPRRNLIDSHAKAPGSVPDGRIAKQKLVSKGLSVDVGEQFRLATEELFMQWEPTPLQTPIPEYPLSARREGIEGFVVAEFELDREGNAVNPRIIESVPAGTFDRAVLRAVKKFVYCPEIVDGIGGNNQPIRKRFSFALRN